MKEYRSRIADILLQKKLRSKGAVLIQGPKWCGKTTTAEQIAKSVLYMANPADKSQNIAISDINPGMLLSGEVPRLIDEWQIAPKLWDAVRFEVDHRSEEGQFILTGSAVPADMVDVEHTGTGRFAWLTMRPMSLFESGESNGSVSLEDLFNNVDISGVNDLQTENLAFLCCRGGWPRSIFLEDDIALEQASDYYDAVVNSDISRVDNVNRNPERVKNLMRSYARNIGTQASLETLKSDMISNDAFSLDTDTVYSYISALKKIFVIEDSPAWSPNLRSRTTIRTSDTKYFVDPSIAVAALGIGPNDLMHDFNTFGLIFESLCIRDLRIYSEVLSGKVYHYRDANDLECDAVIHLKNGKYGLIEIKLGGDTAINSAAENLLKMKNKIDVEKMSEPSFLMVLVGSGKYAYRREDGVFVVPIGCLKY